MRGNNCQNECEKEASAKWNTEAEKKLEDQECSETESFDSFSSEDPVTISECKQGANTATTTPHEQNSDPLNLRASFQKSGGYRSLRQFFVEDLLGAMVKEQQWKPRHLEDFSEALNWTSKKSNMHSSASSLRVNFTKQASSAWLAVFEEKDASTNTDAEDLERMEKEEEHWANRIPKFARPLVGSFLRLIDTVFNMLTFYFLPASIAEISLRGLELIMSVLAQRFIRKRAIKPRRWVGAVIVVVGLAIVLFSEVVDGGSSNMSSGTNVPIGMLMGCCKAILGVSSDMVGEFFMKETSFPPMLLLGTEGVYGLLMAVPLYCILGPFLGYQPLDALQNMFSSPGNFLFHANLICVGHIAWAVFGILVIRTSVVTINLWAGLRGLVTWAIAVIIYYASNQSDLGEEWSVPGKHQPSNQYFQFSWGIFSHTLALACHNSQGLP